jgi:hypothetical protein
MMADGSSLSSVPDPAAIALKLCGDFREILRREQVALRQLDFPELERLHAHKGALRRLLEETIGTITIEKTSQGGEGSPGEAQAVGAALKRLLELQRENERLAERMKVRIMAQMSDLTEKSAVALEYQETSQVSARHVDIVK